MCLSKGLGAPVGSVIVGSKDFIAKVIYQLMNCIHVFPNNFTMGTDLIRHQARRLRKTLGGGMRQVGVLCAAAMVAVQDNVSKLKHDHQRAELIAGCT